MQDTEEVALDIDQIYVNITTNTRDTEGKAYTPEKIHEMMKQIVAVGGLLSPLVVHRMQPVPERDNKEYNLLIGFRRALALIELASTPGTEHFGKGIKCKVIKGKHSFEAMTAIQGLENIAREDLTPMEKSDLIANMLKDNDITAKDVAAFFGMSNPQVSNYLKLQQLPAEVQKKIGDEEGQLPWTSAREIVRSVPPTRWQEFIDYAIGHSTAELMSKIGDLKEAEEAEAAEANGEVSTGKDQQRSTQLRKATELKDSFVPFLQKKLEVADKSTPKFTEADLVQARIDTLNTVMMKAGTQLAKDIEPFIQEQVKAKEDAKANESAHDAEDKFYRGLIKQAEEIYKAETKPDPNNPTKKFFLVDAIAAVLSKVKDMPAEEVAKLGFKIDVKDLKGMGDKLTAVYKTVGEERAAAQKKREETAKKKAEEEAQKKADEEAKAKANQATPATAAAG